MFVHFTRMQSDFMYLSSMIWSNEWSDRRMRWQVKMGNNFTPNKCKTHFNLRKWCSECVCIQAKTNLCLSLNAIVILKIHNITVYAVFCLQYSIMRSCHLSSPSMPSLMRLFSMGTYTRTWDTFTWNIRHLVQFKIQNAVMKDQKKQLYAPYAQSIFYRYSI